MLHLAYQVGDLPSAAGLVSIPSLSQWIGEPFCGLQEFNRPARSEGS
jgi:hypothetical protein